MKVTSLLSIILILGLFPAHSQNKPDSAATEASTPPSAPPQKLTKTETAAVAAYKEDMLATQKWLTSWQETAAASESAAYRLPGKMAAQLAKVRTKGLPSNLSKALATLKQNQSEQAALYKDLPDDEAAAKKWIETKNTDPQFSKARTAAMDRQAILETALIDAGISCGAGVESDLYQISSLAQIKDRWVVILSVYKKFAEAKEDAVRIAKAANVPFSLRGMIYDQKGLHLPQDSEDEIFAGEYLLRRYNPETVGGKDFENHVSVEISAEYEGFAPGYFITVGYIAGTAAGAKTKAEEFKKYAPGTYVKKTRIYMGCLH